MPTINRITADSSNDNTASNILPENVNLNIGCVDNVKQEDKNEVVICTATKTELFYIDKFGIMKVLDSCGKCDECGLMFHESYLHSYDDVDEELWPVFYVGRCCKDCWANS